MPITITAGCSARAVSSVSPVDLLGQGATFSTAGIALAGASKWALAVVTTQDVTVRVSKSPGPNADLVVVSSLTTVVTSAAPLLIEFADEANARIRVTAQATGTTAAVSCDFRAVSP
jgi:hypothetical protein